jgi:hypothetical protein
MPQHCKFFGYLEFNFRGFNIQFWAIIQIKFSQNFQILNNKKTNRLSPVMNRVNCQFAGNLGIVPLAFLA